MNELKYGWNGPRGLRWNGNTKDWEPIEMEKSTMKEPWEKELDKHDRNDFRKRTYTITQEQMDKMVGAAHAGGMLGGQAAYEGCLTIGAVLAEIAFKAGFDKSPGSAPEDDETLNHS